LKTPIFKRDDWLANKVSIQVEVVQRGKTEGKRGSQAAAVEQHYNICQERYARRVSTSKSGDILPNVKPVGATISQKGCNPNGKFFGLLF
jgi:hypothetical protein